MGPTKRVSMAAYFVPPVPPNPVKGACYLRYGRKQRWDGRQWKAACNIVGCAKIGLHAVGKTARCTRHGGAPRGASAPTASEKRIVACVVGPVSVRIASAGTNAVHVWRHPYLPARQAQGRMPCVWCLRICLHNKRKDECRACGGSRICLHNKRKDECIECVPLVTLLSKKKFCSVCGLTRVDGRTHVRSVPSAMRQPDEDRARSLGHARAPPALHTVEPRQCSGGGPGEGRHAMA